MPISNDLIWALIAIIFLIILSALFSGSETAFTATSPLNYLRAKRGDKRAKIFLTLRERMDKLITLLLLGNNFVNVLASAIATSVLINMFGQSGVAYATLIMTSVILIFAEILPKTIAVKHADWLALKLSPFIHILLIITTPDLIDLTGDFMANFTPLWSEFI